MARTSDVIKGSLKYAIGFGLLAWVIRSNWSPKVLSVNPETNEVTQSPGLSGLFSQSPDWLMLVAVAACLSLTIAMQFARWYVLVRAVDLPFTKFNALRLGLVGYFYNLFLPGSIAGDIVKAYFIVKEQPARKAVALATVVIDRLFGLFGLLILAAICGGSAWAMGDERIAGNVTVRNIVIVSIVIVLSALVGWIVLGLLPNRLLNTIEAKLHRLPKVGKSLAEVFFAVRLYRQRPKAIYLCVLISAVSHVSMQFMLHAATRAFPSIAADAGTLAEHFVIGPVGFIGQVFIPAPGGVGGGEWLFGKLYLAINRSETTGVVGRLTIRAAEFLLGMIGYLVYVRMKAELPVEPTGEANPAAA